MGLEIVELIMRVEEEFDITIADSEAEHCATPGGLCDLIERKLGFYKAPSDSTLSCPTSRAFYLVRRELMKLGVQRSHVTPQTSLEALWPRSERRANWESLSEALDYHLPPLHRSPEWAFVGLLPLGVLPVWLTFSPLTGTLACVTYICAWWLGSRLTEAFATHIPDELGSVADLTRRLAPRFATADSTTNIWPQLRHIIADELGIPLEQVTRDADFYRDLGLG